MTANKQKLATNGVAGSNADTHARSTLQSMADILSPSASVVPAAKIPTQKVPGHIANILNVILLHDRFDQNFDKWNLLVADDRDTLVLTLKSGAQVDSSLVYTICMMYPFRIHGPIIMKNTMHVEFMHQNRLEMVTVTSDHTPQNIEYMLGACLHKRKRQRVQDLQTHRQNGAATGSAVTPSAGTATGKRPSLPANTENAAMAAGAGTAPATQAVSTRPIPEANGTPTSTLTLSVRS